MKRPWILWLMMFLLIVASCVWMARKPVQARDTSPALVEVSATAYYDSYGHGYGADGRPLIEELTLAGKPEWLGMTALLYDMDMRLIGIYEFRDVGYGSPTGRGRSQLIKGASLGTIETGQCVDIYMKTEKQCLEWGKRKVFMQLIKAVG